MAKMQNIDNFIPPSSIYIYCEVLLYVHQNKPLNRKPAAWGKNDIFFAASCMYILAFQLYLMRLNSSFLYFFKTSFSLIFTLFY